MKKILLIDDSAIVRMLLSTTLSMGNVQILEAASGEQGLVLAKREQPDLIILDVKMPGELNGLDVCLKLKNSEETRHILVIILTVLDERKRAIEAGADGFIAKPFSPRELFDTVRLFLER